LDRKPTSTQSASHRVISGAGVQFVLQLIGQILALVVTRELLSTFSIAENGVFALIQKTGTIVFTLFVDAGMNGLAIRNVVSAPEEAQQVLSTLFKLRLGLWFVVTTVLISCTAIFTSEYTLTLLWWSIYFLFSAKVGLLRSVLETVYRAHAQFVFVSVLALVDGVLLMFLLMADLAELNIHTVMFWYLLSSIPGFVILFIKADGAQILRIPFSSERAKKLFTDILPFIGTTVLLYINSYSETLFLTFMGTMAHVGVFEALGRIYIPMFMIIGSVQNGIYPFIVQFQKDNMERCKQYVFYGFKFTVVTSLLMAVCSIVIAPWIIQLFTSGKYIDSLDEFMLYPWLLVPNFCLTYVLTICLALGLQRKTFGIALAVTVFELILDPLLIPTFTVKGALVAKLLANLIAWWVAVRVLNEFFEDKRVNKFLARFIPVSVLILTIASIALYELPIIASLVLILSIFVILILVARIVDKSDLRLIQSFVVSLMSKVGIQRN
jgi:O-antigen/teichoic acid export membrane protein